MATKTQIEKIEAVLRKHNSGAGITPMRLANLAKVPYENVGKRIYDLRETYTIYTNYRNVDGKRTAFYRFAG